VLLSRIIGVRAPRVIAGLLLLLLLLLRGGCGWTLGVGIRVTAGLGAAADATAALRIPTQC
jgi:hypothetical protein